MTPAGGPSLPAFLQRVDTLGFYLEDDAVLRIDPLGQYTGKVTMADYIATFVHPTGLGGVFTVAGAGITAFANSGDVAAATFFLDFYATADPRRRISKVSGTMFNRFNSTTQKLRDADWAFLRFPQFQLELAADEPVPSRMSDATSASIVQGVCLVDQTVCKPLNVSGYDSPADCLSYMASIPRVDPYGGQGDNQFCRLEAWCTCRTPPWTPTTTARTSASRAAERVSTRTTLTTSRRSPRAPSWGSQASVPAAAVGSASRGRCWLLSPGRKYSQGGFPDCNMQMAD